MPAPRRARRKSSGLGRVAEAAAKQKGGKKFLKLADGDVVVVRVIDPDDGFVDAFCHRVPMENDDGKEFYADVPCLDQDDKGVPCPGCKDDLDRRYKFWANVIVRDWEEAGSKPKDTLMIWSSGITIGKRLDKLNARHGLANRDIEIEREGSKMNDTKYEIEWATDENVPLSDEDKELAKGAFDLTRYSKPPSFEDFYKLPSERNKDDDDGDVGEKSLRRRGAFNKRKSEDDDDDDKPARRTTTRRTSSTSKKPGGLGAIKAKSKGDDDDAPKKTTVRRRPRR